MPQLQQMAWLHSLNNTAAAHELCAKHAASNKCCSRAERHHSKPLEGLQGCRVYRAVRTPRRSSCFMAEWMQMEGKLHSISSLLSSFARSTLFTKMTTCVVSIAGLRVSVQGDCTQCQPLVHIGRSPAGLTRPSQRCNVLTYGWHQAPV